jgi:hypothetical protein
MPPPSFWTVMRPAMIWPGVLLAFGALFYVFAAGQRDLTADLTARGVMATAQVIARERTLSTLQDRRETFRLHLRFDTPEGPVDSDRLVSREEFLAIGSVEQLRVIHLPEDPRRFRLAVMQDRASAEGALDPRLMGAVPGGIALGLMGWLMVARLPLWRALTGGDRRDAQVAGHHRRPRSRQARLVWTGLDGKAQHSAWMRADRLPPVGATIEVAIDPETGREIWLGEP